ncbi:hypothetical protein CHU98_g3620 [Xylaria longipes]|nr:hypothetical protein CHU98_g3620 [Xylaria longipes]
MGSSTNTPLLPEPGKRNILITSALPYVLSADCFARFSRARGLNTLYICGSDEYGTASETKALEENTTPAELCSKYHELHQRIYDNFSISFDIYGRTSTEQHTQIVQNIFTKLWENGFIEERSSIQPYCPEHHSFLADRYVVGICSLYPTKEKAIKQVTSHSTKIANVDGDALNVIAGYLWNAFSNPWLRQCDSCGKLLDPFEQIVKVNDTAGQELKETDQETKGAAQQRAPKGTGYLINPRCKLDGATPEARIPNGLKGLSDEVYANKVFYVWFDACIGYPSITKMYTDRDDPSGTNWEKWWKNPEDVTLYQFMGKDNVPFHSIVFPACQLGTRENWTKVSRFSTTEYLNYERSKFSKSRNIGVFGTAVKDTGVDTDVWRFYLLCRRPETADAEFLWEDFVSVNNNELLKNLGNLCQRVIKFCHTSLITGVVPDINYTDEGFKAKVNEKLQEYLRNMEGLELRNGARTILAIASLGNEFVQELTKKGVPEDTRISGFNLTLNLILVCPYMPNIASSILTQLGVPMEEQSFTIPDAWTANTLKPGHKLGTPTPLFTQIPASRAEEWQEAFGGDEMRKLKAEEAAKAAAKKAAKQKKKEEKNAKKAAATSGAPLT